MKLKFFKYHALGNDYLILDNSSLKKNYLNKIKNSEKRYQKIMNSI